MDTCIRMIQVQNVWSLNLSASHTLRYQLSLLEFCTKVFTETENFVNKLHMHLSSLLISSLRAIVICQNYFRVTVISSITLLIFTCNETLYTVVFVPVFKVHDILHILALCLNCAIDKRTIFNNPQSHFIKTDFYF